MEKEQIIKALECCIEGECGDCSYDEQTACKEYLLHDALALIRELTVELDAMRGAANSYKMHNERLTEENERLESISINKDITIEAINEVIKQLNEENERLKKAKYIYATVDYCADDLAKALEENKRLTEDNEKLTINMNAYGLTAKRLAEENERLKAEVSVKKKLLDKCVDLEDRVKDDTVKRFAEKLEITLMSRLVTATKEQKAAILFCINQINQTKAIMTKPKDCLQCKHFVGCEPSTLGGCDLYEEEEKK